MKFRLLLAALTAASALTGCVTYDEYGYGAGYYREPGVVYRRYGGYPYGYYDGYYGGYYGYWNGGYPYRYSYPYYAYPRYYYRPPYHHHGGGHRPPNSGGGKPPWRDLDKLRPAEGAQPMRPPPRAVRPDSAPRTPAYRPPAAPAYRPAPVAPRAPAVQRAQRSGGTEAREAARRARAEMKSGSR